MLFPVTQRLDPFCQLWDKALPEAVDKL